MVLSTNAGPDRPGRRHGGLTVGMSTGNLSDYHYKVIELKRRVVELMRDGAAMQSKINALEKQCAEWLAWSVSKGPGLEAYREQGARIAELESALESAHRRAETEFTRGMEAMK